MSALHSYFFFCQQSDNRYSLTVVQIGNLMSHHYPALF
ncbi:hypothetical protein DCWBC2_0156 [Dehalococcoides mccartyi]|nr:hypothetical protein DCWBC2_0156 [Dehalococcoides mccartyi]